ncbi:shikimate kinase [Bremerella alba]|uniref:Shikimate kinase n=1 Tax=Bremerella alba TaxID=980252 RepID=A0A7V8V6I6_9BACT|nr:shikimate kinase [Bremerella alba]MBA2115783.1 Shikimate kinase 1 [Bremerella alba]
MNLALIGYRGTGKSHVARLLAHKLAWPLVDADIYVEKQAGKSIAEIFADSGEPGFRDLESNALNELTQRSGHVLSLGGGVILREENRSQIAKHCFTIWLTASPEEITRRLSREGATQASRPSLTGRSILEEVAEVLAQRLPLYEQCADLTIDTQAKSPKEVMQAILAQLPSSLVKKEQ